MDAFKKYIQEGNDSQFLLSLNIENTESIYKLAIATKNAEELKKVVLDNKTKLSDDKKINYEKINWKEVYAALKDN